MMLSLPKWLDFGCMGWFVWVCLGHMIGHIRLIFWIRMALICWVYKLIHEHENGLKVLSVGTL